MTDPKPLSATPPARLHWSGAGEPVAQDFDDVYFSVDGGWAETKAVFLSGCGLPEAWREQDVFTIGELGFGSGLNFLAVWDLWRKSAKAHQSLHFLSVEAFPLSKGQLIRALEKFPKLAPLAEQMIALWPDRVRGVHRLEFGNVILTLFHSEVDHALSGMDARIDAWFLDGFSPAKNMDMWSEQVFAHLARLSTDGARLATFTVAGHVRRGLAAAGFTVEKKPGFGRKRERLEAVYKEAVNKTDVTQVTTKTRAAKPIIIGAGIAGACLAHAFARKGIEALIIEPGGENAASNNTVSNNTASNRAASGNPAGLVMPKLDLQDRPESRFYNAAFLYARTLFRKFGEVLHTGVLQMAGSDKEQKRFEKIARAQALPLAEMRFVEKSEAEIVLNQKLSGDFGGLYFPNALAVSPRNSVQLLAAQTPILKARASRVQRSGNKWLVFDATGTRLAESLHVFICNGANILDLWPLDIRFTRGQVCWGHTPHKLQCSFIAGNYAVPFQGGLLLGATHDHVGAGEQSEIREQDTQEILAAYNHVSGQNIQAEGWQARAAVRVTTRNTLPIADQADDGLYLLSGLGSRGLMMAPLLAESLVCKALGQASPLDIGTQKRFSLQVRA